MQLSWLVLILLQQATQIKGNLQPLQENQTNLVTLQNVFVRGMCSTGNNILEARHGECSWRNHTAQCYGGVSKLFEMRPHRLRKLHELILCSWSNETFDPTILKKFTKLRIFRMEHGQMANIVNDFPELKFLQNINISYTRLANTRHKMFKQLPAIESIDLRWNQLDHISGPFAVQSAFRSLYLSDNVWNCSKNFKWLLNYTKANRIIDRETLQCSDSIFKNQTILKVMQIKESLHGMCQNNLELRNCSCSLSYIALDIPIYSINCSNLNLTRLPASVPENTTIFHATNNQISSIEPLLNAYRSVQDIYLDYNQIRSIDTLESGSWLEQFRAFSLRGNQLTKLPVYLLNNALEKNHQGSAMYLSENPWRCECTFTMRFREFLQRHRDIVKDGGDIRCQYIETGDDEKLANSVLALKRADVCLLPTKHVIEAIDLLNGIMATLIIFIVVKLIYDYYYYRKAGRLPWLVTKMP